MEYFDFVFAFRSEKFLMEHNEWNSEILSPSFESIKALSDEMDEEGNFQTKPVDNNRSIIIIIIIPI